MRLAWATDIHLDHASESARRKFCQFIKEQADALVIMGDTAESHVISAALTATATLAFCAWCHTASATTLAALGANKTSM